MLHTCEELSSSRGVISNPHPRLSIQFQQHTLLVYVTLCGQQLPLLSSVTHLGHLLTNLAMMKTYSLYTCYDMIGKSNSVLFLSRSIFLVLSSFSFFLCMEDCSGIYLPCLLVFWRFHTKKLREDYGVCQGMLYFPWLWSHLLQTLVQTLLTPSQPHQLLSNHSIQTM